jgi:hypothetical protein
MVVAAEWGGGQVFWSLFWAFLFFMCIWLVIMMFIDIIRSPDLGGVAKAVWTFFIIVLPVLGVMAYLVVRGDSLSERISRHGGHSTDPFDMAMAAGGGKAYAESDAMRGRIVGT